MLKGVPILADNGTIMKGLYASFAKGDIPAVLEGFDPNIEWTEPEGLPYAGTYNGTDAVLNKVFMTLGTDWDGFTVAPDEFVASGDRVIALGHLSGTYKKTGKSFKVPFVHAWRLKDGKPTHFEQYTNTAIVQQVLA
jgi:ketosteroid isomerase-like protein